MWPCFSRLFFSENPEEPAKAMGLQTMLDLIYQRDAGRLRRLALHGDGKEPTCSHSGLGRRFAQREARGVGGGGIRTPV